MADAAGPLGWSLESPAGVSGALAVIRIGGSAEALDAWLTRSGIGPVAVGASRLCSLLGVDEGLVTRWSADSVYLTPHGGAGVLRVLGRALIESGVPAEVSGAWAGAFPEAESEVEAAMLETLGRSASPRAVDLLLAQPSRWQAGEAPDDPARERALALLVSPPLVAAVGPANVGKSSLLNALAGRSVAVVADQAGTTRDHVGALVDLDGLVVRWADTPGALEAPGGDGDAEAAAIARALVESADLVVRCGDHTAGPAPMAGDARKSVSVGLRSDLWPAADLDWRPEVVVSVETGAGLARLAGLIRDRLVPDRWLADGLPWRFWDPPTLPTTPPGGIPSPGRRSGA